MFLGSCFRDTSDSRWCRAAESTQPLPHSAAWPEPATDGSRATGFSYVHTSASRTDGDAVTAAAALQLNSAWGGLACCLGFGLLLG